MKRTRAARVGAAGALVAALTAGRAAGQSVPEGWVAVADAGDAEGIELVAMAPGWHHFPGPAALLYEPDREVDGSFRVELDAHGFVDGTGAYGVFFGARGVEPSSYDFFEIVLDGEGRYRLGHNAGTAYHEVVPWTRHEAIAVPAADAPAFNSLVVDVSDDRLAVTVNGVELTSFDPPEYARFEGIVGLRMLDGASVHVTRLEVTDTPAGGAAAR